MNLSYHWADAQGRTVVWDGVRTKLPGPVAPGQSVTVNATVRFPSAGGQYVLRWDLVEEGVSWFSVKGAPTFDQAMSVSAATSIFYGGSMDVSATPATMPNGLVSKVSLRVQNLSNFAWDSSINLSYHWYDESGKVVVWDGLRTPLAGVQANEVRTLMAEVLAPAASGTYVLRFDIVREGFTWFSGAGMQLASRNVRVEVPPYGAAYLAPSVLSGQAGAQVSVPVTVTNTGTIAWLPGMGFNLSYHVYGPAGQVVVWDGVRTPIEAAVSTGQSLTVNAVVLLPASAGTYEIRFDMVQEGTTWFSTQGITPASATLLAQ